MSSSLDMASRKKSRWLGSAVALSWAASLAGFAGRYWWPFDLLSSFRPHYAVAFLLAAVLLLAARRWGLVAVALAGLAVNATVLTVPFGVVHASGDSTVERDGALRVVTLNVWFRNRNYDRVARYLATTDADVIVLQEVDAAQVLEIASRLSTYPHVYVDAARELHGAAILSRHPILDGTAVQLVPDGVIVASVRIDLAGQPVRVIGAHLHWPVGPRVSTLRNAELEALAGLAARSDGPLVIVGDLNVTLWSPWFARLVADSGLTECSGGNALPSSWPAWLGPAGIRIDHCLVSKHLTPLATRAGARVGSDHTPVVTDLALAPRVALR